MKKGNVITLIVLGMLLAIDYIADKIYESGKALFDLKVAMLQMQNSDTSYLAYSLYSNTSLYYGIMFLINLVIILILIGFLVKKSK